MKVIVLSLWISFMVNSLTQSCLIDVSQDMVRRLVDPTETLLACDRLWSKLLLHFHYTHKNLTMCLDRELSLHIPAEPSFSDCQQKLENSKLEAEANDRSYTAEMQKKIQLNEWNARKYQEESDELENQITRTSEELKSSYRTLILLNVQAGAAKEALKYYHRYLQGHEPSSELLKSIIETVYRQSAHQNERFEYLLDFTRKLPGKGLRLKFYKLIEAELQNHQSQRDSYLAMIFALDVGRLAFRGNYPEALQLYNVLFEPALKHLRDAVAAGRYDEIVLFAKNYPNHFEQIENRLSTLDTNVWNRVDFNQFVMYPNQLPLAKQRIEAFRMILLQINQHNKHNFAELLMKVAQQLDECETFVMSGQHERTDLDKLVTVKRLFAIRNANQDYEYYLKESRKTA